MPSKTRGLFISFEGGEGTGKSTQIERLATLFRALGREVLVTREPGGNPIAERIRARLVSYDIRGIAPLAELLLYAASRAEHTQQTILPALARGAVVLSDGYSDSSLVYQGVGRRLSPSLVARINRIATGGVVPRVTIVLDLDPKLALARAGRRGQLDRLEAESLEFHRKVRSGFRALVKRQPRRCFLFSALPGPDEVERSIRRLLERQGLLE